MLALELIELAGERGVGGEESPQADEGAARCAVSLALIWVSKAPRTRIRCEPPRGFRDSLVVGVLLEGTGISNFKGISRGNWRFRRTIEMPKCYVFYTLTWLGIRLFEPGGSGVRIPSGALKSTYVPERTNGLDETFWKAVLLKGTCAIQTFKRAF